MCEKRPTTADRLNQLLSDRNMKQIDIYNAVQPLCKQYKMRIGRNDISQYVSGKVVPRQNKVYVLARALNVNEAWLMGYDVPMERQDDKDVLENTPTSALTDNERQILDLYKNLNPLGQEVLMTYAKAMTDNPKYVATDTKTKITEDVIDEFLQVPTPTPISTK